MTVRRLRSVCTKVYLRFTKRTRMMGVIAKSRLFDPDWYLSQNPDIAVAQIDPLAHYFDHGASEGRDPHPLFDTDWYLSRNPNAARAKLNPLFHYVTKGASEGRDPHPLFDSKWYASQKPDFAATEANPLVHYMLHGAAAGLDPHPLFDADWYLSQNPDVALGGLNPLVHYMFYGAWEGRDPHPLFDNDWYLSQHPDVAQAHINPLTHYVAHGASERREPNWFFDTASYLAMHSGISSNPLAHYIAHNPQLTRRRENAFNAVAKTINALAFIEPDLRASVLPETLKQLKVLTGHARGPWPAAWRTLFRSFNQFYDRMIFIPSLSSGEPDVVAMNALRAAQERHGVDSTLVVADELDVSARQRFPPGTHVRVVSELHPRLSPSDRIEIISSLIYHLQPTAVLNVNSAGLWQAIEQRGMALSRVTRLFACISSRTSTTGGRAADHWLKTCLPYLTRVYTDSSLLRNAFIRDHDLPEPLQDKLIVLYQPVTARPIAGFSPQSDERTYPVFLADQLFSKASLDLLVEIARRCPDISFDVYGRVAADPSQTINGILGQNIRVKGPLEAFGTIPVERYAAYLYSSLDDGLSPVVIDIAMRGVPVVASGVGGMRDLVDADTGWLIENYREPSCYVEALQQLRRNSVEVARRVTNMATRLGHRYSWSQYVELLGQGGSFLD